MTEYILGATAVMTVLINSFLVYYLISYRFIEKAAETGNKEVVNFVLAPIAKESPLDTEILATEVIAGGVYDEGDKR